MLAATLKKPYPFYSNSKQQWQLVIALSFFIAFFCMAFRPFGIDNPQGSLKYLLALGFGGVTFVVETFNMVLLPRIFPKILSDRAWTVGKEIMWVLWMIFMIATANYAYAVSVYPVAPTLEMFLLVHLYTMSVATIPAIGIIFFKQLYAYKKVLREVGVMNDSIENMAPNMQSERVVLKSETGNEKVDLRTDEILYIESAGNYIEVFFQKEGKLKKELLRNKISEVQRLLEPWTGFVRCHRTFIINLPKVERVEGNAQGYRLKLSGSDALIPVARSNSKKIREMVAHL